MPNTKEVVPINMRADSGVDVFTGVNMGYSRFDLMGFSGPVRCLMGRANDHTRFGQNAGNPCGKEKKKLGNKGGFGAT
jgi:hypothetical protein